MDEKVQQKLTETYQQYRRHLQEIADNPETDTREKLEEAQAHHRVAVDMQRAAALEWSAALDQRGADLEKVLYHGDKDYKAAIREAASKDDRGLEELARLASRTGDETLARAAAVVAYERGNRTLFNDYYVHSGNDFAQAYRELLEIPAPDERSQWAQQFVPPAPEPHHLSGAASKSEWERREEATAEATRAQVARNTGGVLGRRLI